MRYKTIKGQWFACEFNEPLDFYDQYYYKIIFSKGHFLLKRYSGINTGKINAIDTMGPFPCIVTQKNVFPEVNNKKIRPVFDCSG